MSNRARPIPTSNQAELDDLARWLGGYGWYVMREQETAFDLGEALEAVQRAQVCLPPWHSGASVRRICERIDRQVQAQIAPMTEAALEQRGQPGAMPR